MSALKRFQFLEGTQLMMWNCAPVLVAVASFTTYILSGYKATFYDHL
jgi:hypothetical protein